MPLRVPLAPEGLQDVPLTKILAEWTQGIQRRGDLCPDCDRRSALETKRLLTGVQNVLCLALDREPMRQVADHPAMPTTTTPVALPAEGLDLAPFFHPGFHHAPGTQLFRMTAVVCYDKGCADPGKNYSMPKYVTYAEHPRSGAWFRHDRGTATLADLSALLLTEEVRRSSVAAFYRRHEPTSPHHEDHGAATVASPLSAEGRWRADVPVGMLQEGPMPEALRKRQKTGIRSPTLAQAMTAAQRSASSLDKLNKSKEALKSRRTAAPKKAVPRTSPAAASESARVSFSPFLRHCNRLS